MKAIVQDEYGPPDVLELREIDKPVVEDDEVLVRVRAASANPADWHSQSGQKYDLILQLAGTRSPSDCRRARSPPRGRSC